MVARLLSPTDIRRLLDDHGLRPSRALGQNFLADPNTARRIVRLAGVGEGDRVIEVGPGVGSLTLALAEQVAAVTAVELDRHLLPALADALGDVANVEVVQGDAMEVDYDALLGPAPGAWVMVANLPYNVATPLVAHLLDDVPQLRHVVVMVQKEVAQRLVAAPGTSGCGGISVKVAYHCEARNLAVVPPTVFMPRPRVDSAVIALDRRAAPPVEVPSLEGMMRLVRSGFGQRRKMLRQSLRAELGDGAEAAMVAAGLDPAARAEALRLEDWAALARAVAGRATGGPS